jgi:AcrR family transcriptional regulator
MWQVSESSLRDRIVEAATLLTSEQGWSAVTMLRLGGLVGVSRQSVYNEVGSKPQLAEAMVAAELERFLAVVDAELRAGDDLIDAIERAALRVFLMADEDALLRAVIRSADGGNNELLPLLTTNSLSVIEPATRAVVVRIRELYPDEIESVAELDLVSRAIVRLVLSNVTTPTGTAQSSAAEIAWLAQRVIAGGRPNH